MTRVLDAVRRYYSEKIVEHGPTAKGVDWNDQASQELRFDQLLKVCDPSRPFSLNDYGCGYGALARYLGQRGYTFRYTGFDISDEMVAKAQELLRAAENYRFVGSEGELEPADYTVASGSSTCASMPRTTPRSNTFSRRLVASTCLAPGLCVDI